MKKVAILFLTFIPSVTFASLPLVTDTFSNVVSSFLVIVDMTMPVLAGASLLVFFWGLVKFVTKSGDEKSHKEGQNLMTWGIIALFIMVSFMSIVQFLYGGVGFTGFGFPLLPTHN